MSDKDNVLKKCNVIKQMAVSELLDGRTFFIPSYPRGYRWTKTQISDLCNDLLEYALRKDKDQKAFVVNYFFAHPFYSENYNDLFLFKSVL